MSRFNKIIAVILTFTLIFGLTTAYAVGEIEMKMSGDVEGDKVSNKIKVTGRVTYSNLETGFYAVSGYRLVGELDYENLEGKMVEVKGVIDTRPSIYMTKAIRVESIVIIEDNAGTEFPNHNIRPTSEQIRNIMEQTGNYREQIERQIMQKREEMINASDDLDKYISQYGENSAIVDDYKQKRNELMEEIDALRVELERVHEREAGHISENADLIEMLENIVELDGSNADLEKYRQLGKALSTHEAKLNVFINGKRPIFQDGVVPIAEDGRTLIPFRVIAESLGAEVIWDQERYTVVVIKDDITVELPLNEKIAYINGKPVELDVPAKVVNERTLVPLRFVSEALKAHVEWIPEGQVIVVYDAQDMGSETQILQ